MADAWIDLADAIEGLRSALTEAINRGAAAGMHFRLAPIELTLEAAVTKEGRGQVGWKVLELGGSRGTTATQTLKLSLTPVWMAADGTTFEDPLVSAVVHGDGQQNGASAGAGRGPKSSAQPGVVPPTEADQEDDA